MTSPAPLSGRSAAFSPCCPGPDYDRVRHFSIAPFRPRNAVAQHCRHAASLVRNPIIYFDQSDLRRIAISRSTRVGRSRSRVLCGHKSVRSERQSVQSPRAASPAAATRSPAALADAAADFDHTGAKFVAEELNGRFRSSRRLHAVVGQRRDAERQLRLSHTSAGRTAARPGRARAAFGTGTSSSRKSPNP